MGDPIIIWPPCGGDYQQNCATALGYGWVDCTAEYQYALQPGEEACCWYEG